MKKGQIMEGVVERVDFPNKGILSTEEGKVVVKNTIAGAKIQFAISKKRGGKAEGRLLEVLRPSALEKRERACDSFPACGGCTWQTMEYEEQLRMKAEQVKRLLKPVLDAAKNPSWENEEGADLGSHAKAAADRIGAAGIFEGIHGSPNEFAYRNKMEFSFGDSFKDGPLCLGLHKKGSRYDVLTADTCRLVHADLTAILKETLKLCRERRLPYYHKMTHEGILRHLLLRRAEKTGEILVALVTASFEEKEGFFKEDFLLEFKQRLLALKIKGHIAGILHMRNDSVADVVQSEETTILYGQDFFYESLLGLNIKITPFSFFQTNSLGAEVLYGTAREFVGDTKASTLFDLYSGTGTIAQVLSPVAREVIGVEIVEEAVEAARINAKQNGLTNCRFLAGDVLRVLDTIEEKPDFIVLDPPRDGIHPKALPKIIAYGAPHILYISCKPTSLARDLEPLLLGGYRAERICCVDMFPQTTGIETVVLLSLGTRQIRE